VTAAEFERELAEKREDAAVFSQAYDLVHQRLLRSERESASRLPLHMWAGATGTSDVLLVMMNQLDGLVEEMIEKRGELVDSGPFELIEGGAA
jgi:hypothetical protein